MHCEAAPGIYLLYSDGFSSNSVVVKAKKNFLVDPGMGNIKAQLSAVGLSISDIDMVVNTHCHYDHIANNRLFSCPVYAHEPDLSYIKNADPEYTLSGMFGALAPKQGNCIEIGTEFQGWNVISTPGHTEGGICLFRNGTLISGDTLFADGYGRTDLPGGDESKMNDSLLMLERLGYELLLPGHGSMAKS